MKTNKVLERAVHPADLQNAFTSRTTAESDSKQTIRRLESFSQSLHSFGSWLVCASPAARLWTYELVGSQMQPIWSYGHQRCHSWDHATYLVIQHSHSNITTLARPCRPLSSSDIRTPMFYFLLGTVSAAGSLLPSDVSTDPGNETALPSVLSLLLLLLSFSHRHPAAPRLTCAASSQRPVRAEPPSAPHSHTNDK